MSDNERDDNAMLRNYEQELRDWATELLAAVRAGQLSVADVERELGVCRAITELTKLGIDMKLLRPAAADEQLRCQQQLLALWPEACARAGVAVIDMPTEVLRAVAAVTGRPH
jgi:hypothetical protein